MSGDARLAELLARGDSAAILAYCRDQERQGGASAEVLLLLSRQALSDGDHLIACEFASRAATAQPDAIPTQMALGFAALAARRFDVAATAFLRAAALDERVAVALLYAAQALTRMGEERAAACAYGLAQLREPALREAYRDPRVPDAIRHLSQQANDFLRDFEIASYETSIGALAARAGAEAVARLRRFIRIYHGLESVQWADPRQQPALHFFPGLTARPWYEHREFAWADEFAAATDAICSELAGAVGQQADRNLEPYVAAEHTGAGWEPLAGALNWGSYHLLRAGAAVPGHAAACPQTVAALRKLPLAQAAGHAPEAFFSVLRPGTRIPPHFGISNTKLAVHLPLLLSAAAGLRVGGETRSWKMGQVTVFDDSFEHEAWNEGPHPRVVLITEVWHPELTGIERAGLEAIMATIDRWNRSVAALTPEALLTDLVAD